MLRKASSFLERTSAFRLEIRSLLCLRNWKQIRNRASSLIIIDCLNYPHRARKYHTNVVTKSALQKCDVSLSLSFFLQETVNYQKLIIDIILEITPPHISSAELTDSYASQNSRLRRASALAEAITSSFIKNVISRLANGLYCSLGCKLPSENYTTSPMGKGYFHTRSLQYRNYLIK